MVKQKSTVAWPAAPGPIARALHGSDRAQLPTTYGVGDAASLRWVFEIMHDCSFPMAVIWGDDYRLFCNDAFVGWLGLTDYREPGTPLSRLWPGFERIARRLLAQVRAGRTTGLQERQRIEAALLAVPDGWFDMSFAPLRGQSGRIEGALVTATVVGNRASSLRALRNAEARQRFVLTLTDAIRPLTDPAAIEATALRLLGRHLMADGVTLGKVAGDDARISFPLHNGGTEAAGLTGDVRLADLHPNFAAALQKERSYVVSDIASAQDLAEVGQSPLALRGIRALVAVPLIQANQVVACLVVHQDTPRPWSDLEIALIEETAERTWTAILHARATATLAASEELFRSFAENSADVLWISPANHRGLSYLSPSFDRVFGETRQSVLADIGKWTALVHPDDLDSTAEASRKLVAGQTTATEYRIIRPNDGEIRHIHDTGFPVLTPDGKVERVAGIATDVTVRRKTEAALRQNEAKYRALFDAIDQGFCIVEMIFDADGRPKDYRFLEANPVFEDQTGLSDAVGRTARELVPTLDQWWIDTYGAVARTGQSVRFEHDARPLDRCFDVFAARVGGAGSSQVAIVFRDVTQHRRAEAALRQSEAHKAFLLALSDAVRPLADPDAISDTAMRHLSHHLGANRVVYFGVEGADYVVLGQHSSGVRPMRGRYPISMFDEGLFPTLSQGRASVSNDVFAGNLTPRERSGFTHLRLRSYIGVPLVKNGKLVGGLAVHCADPRVWTADDIALVDDVAERTWATVERARAYQALASSERRFRSLTEGIPQLVWRSSDHGSWTWVSPQWTAFTGQSADDSLGWGWLDRVHPEDRPVATAGWERARQTGLFEAEYRLHDQATLGYRWFQTRALPVNDPQGSVVEWLGTSTDVQDLREMQERLTALVAELQHRTRNLMAVVSAITDRTLMSSTSLDDFRVSIQSRLGSISRTSGLLSRLEGDVRITFGELLRMVLLGHGIDPRNLPAEVTIHGPAGARLRSSAVQTLALALHELAANALRHGALSVADGRLRIAWEVAPGDDGARLLAIAWTETVAASAMGMSDKAGLDRQFGRELIEHALPYQLGAQTSYALTADMFDCRITLPLPR